MLRNILTIVCVSAALVSAGSDPAVRASISSPPPAPSAPKPVMVEIPYGILIKDASCPGATHALLDPCAPHGLEVYIAIPEGQDIAEFEGKNVILRGALRNSECARLVLRATEIGASTEPFICEKPRGS